MEFCRKHLHCCACNAKPSSANEEQQQPVRVVQPEEVLPPLLRIDTGRPTKQSSAGERLKTPTSDAADVRRISSALLTNNRPIERPSDLSEGSTRNFESIITLRKRDPNMAEEDRRLTLGGDQRYMTEPSRMRYSEDVANRNVLSSSSNVYPNPSPPAGKSLPLSVGPGKYGGDVADRAISQANSAAKSSHSSAPGSIPSRGSDTSSPNTEEYYTSRFKPTQDAYTPEQRHSAERKLLGLSSLNEGVPEHDSMKRDRRSLDSGLSSASVDKDNSKRHRPSLGGKKSSSDSAPKRSTAASGSSAATALTPEETETKEATHMARDNFYDSRAKRPPGRIHTAGPFCPVDSQFEDQEGAAGPITTLKVERPKVERQISPFGPPSVLSKEPTPEQVLPSAAPPTTLQETQPSLPVPSVNNNHHHNTLGDSAPRRGSTGGLSAKDFTSLTTGDSKNSKNSSLPPTARPVTPYTQMIFDHVLPFFHTEIVPPPEVFDSERASQSSRAQDKDHAEDGTRRAQSGAQDLPASSPPAVPPPAPSTVMNGGQVARIGHPMLEVGVGGLKTGKTWPIKFDTESGGYEGLEEVVAEKRRKMVVGGLFRRTDTVDRAMPGAWAFDGAVKG